MPKRTRSDAARPAPAPTPIRQQPQVAQASLRPNPALAKRRRRVIGGGATILVVGIGAGSAFGWPGYARPALVEPAELAVTTPQPRPTATAAERVGEQTALVKAIPDIVQYWVQSGITSNVDWQHESYAIEAWNVNYLDEAARANTIKSNGGTNSVANYSSAITNKQRISVTIGQWESETEASQFYRKQKAQVEVAAINVNSVFVGEQVVGEYALFDLGGGQGEIWWRNGTVVIRASGPLDALTDFYSTYRL